MYLLDNTTEAQEMRRKIYSLFMSGDESNEALAFQLIEGGGFHQELIAPLVATIIANRFWQDYESIVKKHSNFLELFKQDLQDVKQFIEEKLMGFSQYDSDNQLEVLKNYPTLAKNWREIVGCVFQLTTFGGRTCFQQQIFPVQTIFEVLLKYNDTLILTDFGLEDLPTEIATVKATYIELYDNPFQNLQEKEWVNMNIKHVYLDSNLPLETIRKILKHFPTAQNAVFNYLAGSLKSSGHRAQRENRMEEAQELSLRALALYKLMSVASRDKNYYHNRAHSYNNSGKYEMALKCYEHIMRKYPDSYDDCLYNMACTYSRLHQKNKMLECIAIYLEDASGEYARNNIMSDNDFEFYWEDEDFKGLLQARIDMNNDEFDEHIKHFLGNV
jgi:tetratricopeptide (TPR) repeat protein